MPIPEPAPRVTKVATVRTMPPRLETSFIEHLRRSERLSARDADAAVRHALQVGLSVVDAVMALGVATEPAVYEALAAAANMPFAQPKSTVPSGLAVKLVPARVARRHCIVPVGVDDRTLTFLTARPLDVDAERDIGFTSGRRAVAVLGCRSDVQSLLERTYPLGGNLPSLLARFECERAIVHEHVDQLAEAHSNSAAVELCNALVARAIEAGASDLHLDPSAEATSVRLRVGGVLDTVLSLPTETSALVRNRLKILAKADIAVRQRPQDGAFAVRLNGRRVDVRLSSVPTTWGEKIVLRIIDSGSELQSLAALGYDADTLTRLRRALDRPDGLVLVTGPTGSGKTTALYAALGHLRSGRTSIISVEDPVERAVAGINQIPVNARAGNSFASVLRSVLRQDPDVLMVGEIRDAEVAAIVGQAAYTGHLVLSSVHTTDAPSAVKRLLNLDLEPFKIAECLSGIVAQRLVRHLCPACRVILPEFEARRLGREHNLPRILASAGPGCDQCKGTGYTERVPVFELLTPTDPIRQDIARGVSAADLRAAMRAAGMPTMRDCAARLLAEGVTSIEEIHRVLGADDVAMAPAPAAPGARALVADDDAITRTLLHVLLEREGYTVADARTGREAVQLARRTRPDLILMDLNMPQMDGYEAIHELRQMPALAHVPIVVITAEEGVEVERRVLNMGADDYLLKPFEAAVLASRVQAVFSRRRLAGA